MRALSFDIFCRVIDNYGDIGVCWRLARQLKNMPAQHQVRLWVDDLHSFARIEPGIDTHAQTQSVSDIDIIHWTDHVPRLTPAEVVIEAFACEPPSSFINDMRAQNSLWINLEYLSAEAWVESCHARPSIQSTGLRKAFFFPGFTAATGGLLREPDLLARRDRWLTQPLLRRDLLRSIGLSEEKTDSLQNGARQVLLFCYPDAPVQGLLDSLRRQSASSVLIVPAGVLPSLKAQGTEHVFVHEFPFVDQDAFDQLLWSSDLNFVRGEDSLLRALWAAKPLVWQVYPQEHHAHLTKLQALLDISPLDSNIKDLMLAWNTGHTQEFSHQLDSALPSNQWARWQKHSDDWMRDLSKQPDLALSLVTFAAKQQRTG